MEQHAAERAAAEIEASREQPPREPLERGAPASWPGRLGAAETALLVFAIAGDVVDHLPVAGGLAAAFLLGLALGLVPQIQRAFHWITGWIAGCILMGCVFAVVVSLNIVFGTPHVLLLTVPLVGLVPMAADWRYASRLRLWIRASGLALILVVGISVDTFAGIPRGRALLAAGAWLAVALTTLRVLNYDINAAVPRPAPESGGEARAKRRNPLDLPLLALATLLGLVYL